MRRLGTSGREVDEKEARGLMLSGNNTTAGINEDNAPSSTGDIDKGGCNTARSDATASSSDIKGCASNAAYSVGTEVAIPTAANGAVNGSALRTTRQRAQTRGTIACATNVKVYKPFCQGRTWRVSPVPRTGLPANWREVEPAGRAGQPDDADEFPTLTSERVQFVLGERLVLSRVPADDAVLPTLLVVDKNGRRLTCDGCGCPRNVRVVDAFGNSLMFVFTEPASVRGSFGRKELACSDPTLDYRLGPVFGNQQLGFRARQVQHVAYVSEREVHTIVSAPRGHFSR
jgi:hypothetical protein